MMVAAPLSTGLYSTFGPSSIVTILAIAPVALMPLIVLLREDKPVAVRSVGDRLQDIWTTTKSRSVWQPMAFVSQTCTFSYANASILDIIYSHNVTGVHIQSLASIKRGLEAISENCPPFFGGSDKLSTGDILCPVVLWDNAIQTILPPS